jgi:acyl carrier protein
MSAEIRQKVVDVLVDILGVKPEVCTPEARLVEDLQVSSIDQVDIIAEFENTFGIHILDSEAVKVTTVGKMTELLSTKVAEKAKG